MDLKQVEILIINGIQFNQSLFINNLLVDRIPDFEIDYKTRFVTSYIISFIT